MKISGNDQIELSAKDKEAKMELEQALIHFDSGIENLEAEELKGELKD